MVTDQQVRKLMSLIQTGTPIATAATKAGMCENTARKYVRAEKLPSHVPSVRNWRTREDPFEDVWPQIESKLAQAPDLQAKTLFEDLQSRFPGRFGDGQRRTLERRVKVWRALRGPGKEVFFPQVHQPGVLCASDFTHLTDLKVTIARQPFRHMFYHFVLTYSNWETGTLCFSECFEALSVGLQNALFALGGVPRMHRTDRLTAAVHKVDHPNTFTDRYEALLAHYSLIGQKTRPASGNENGDCEQRHYRFKEALDQALLLRGHRDFDTREEYVAYLDSLIVRLNAGRTRRLQEEIPLLSALPGRRIEDCKRIRARVGPSSVIRAANNVYSVPSRLIGEQIEVRLFSERLEVWYAQQLVETLARLPSREQHRIDYRHIIDWLLRKPGAFEGYRYRADLFPTSRFRQAYDQLRESDPATAARSYLAILEVAARQGEGRVDDALRLLQAREEDLSHEALKQLLSSPEALAAPPATDVRVAPVDLNRYDRLLQNGQERP